MLSVRAGVFRPLAWRLIEPTRGSRNEVVPGMQSEVYGSCHVGLLRCIPNARAEALDRIRVKTGEHRHGFYILTGDAGRQQSDTLERMTRGDNNLNAF